MWHVVDDAGLEHGPMVVAAVVERVVNGGLTEDSLVRAADTPLKFRPLKTIRELKAALDQQKQAAAPTTTSDAAPKPEVAGAEANEWWYCDDGGCERGPLSIHEMRELVTRGFVVGPRLVRHGALAQDISLWPELDPAAADPITGEAAVIDSGAGEWEADEEEEWLHDEEEWTYIDDDGGVQGPFSTSEMREWVLDGHLEPTRHANVAGGDLEDFRPISDWPELVEEGAAASVEQHIDVVPPTPSDASTAAKAAAATAAEAVAEGWYYLDDRGGEQGPFSLAKLCTWVRRGLLGSERLVRSPASSGSSVVKALSEWPELSAALSDAVQSEAAATAAAPRASGSDSDAVVVQSSTHAAPQAAPMTDEEAASLWVYRDDRGKEQGPFTARKLLGWLKAGHIRASRLARPHEQGATNEGGNGRDSYRALSDTPLFARALDQGILPAVPPRPQSLGGKAASATVETPLWFYIGAGGEEHGPFGATLMQGWATHGYLPPATLVRHLSEPVASRRPLASVPQLACMQTAPSSGDHLREGGASSLTAASHYGAATAGQEAQRVLTELHSSTTAHAAPQQIITDAAGRPVPVLPEQQAAVARGLAPTATTAYKDYSVVGGFNQVTGRFTDPAVSGDNYWDAKGIPRHRDERQMGHYFDLDAWQEQRNAASRHKQGGHKQAKRPRQH
jgi:hypothetical protein